jgi:ATPase subunit of ABC transporter with duplicated ATPase domains
MGACTSSYDPYDPDDLDVTVKTVSDTSGVGVGGSSDDATTTSAVHCRVGIVGDKGVGKSALFDHLKVHLQKAVDTSPDSVRSCTYSCSKLK